MQKTEPIQTETNEVYISLARHLEHLIMGYPYSEAVIDLLQAMFNPDEARVAAAIPNDLVPFQVVPAEVVAAKCTLPGSDIKQLLQDMADRRVIYSADLPGGKPGYALLQVGYGMPQTFFWSGVRDERARKMARLVVNYFKVPVTRKVYGGVPTKTYKYSPANLSIDLPMQGVLPHEQIQPIVSKAQKIAVAHCPCRLSASILGRTDCPHSLEVCLKYDELAEFVLAKGLAREISRDEALHILTVSEKEGLVHMVDNAQGEIKHTCNCCGHYCWNVGIIKRRKIPRDTLMAVYFIRRTEGDACVGCGACVDICPVAAVTLDGDRASVDMDWCIGCGVCAVVCPAEAIAITRRIPGHGPQTVSRLHERIKKERGISA